MAHAHVKGARYNVRVVQDLAANWSVEVYPVPRQGEIKRSEPFKNWPVPLCIKICADTRADALVMGLEQMKKLGKIDDFHIDESERPVPPPPSPKPATKPPAEATPEATAKPAPGAQPNPATKPETVKPEAVKVEP